MKKKLSILLCLLLVGCTDPEPQKATIEIDQNATFTTSTDNFYIRLDVYELNENEYRYDITIDNPQIDMYQLQALVVCETETAEAYPSFGFEDNDTCNLLPGQVNTEENCYKGIRLSGVSSSKDVVCKVYVYYINNDVKQSEYIELRGTINDEA